MPKSLENIEQTINVAEIVHHGDKLTLPEGMSIDGAIQTLERRRSYLEEDVSITRRFNVFPWDGANALSNVLKSIYGWVSAEPIPSFFGSRPPRMIGVEVAPGVKRQIPWGRFALPNVRGTIDCSAAYERGILGFCIEANIKRESEHVINDLFACIEAELKVNSIYQGKAIRMRFLDDDGDMKDIPEIKFIDVSGIDRDMVIYSKPVQDSIETNLFTPIERAKDCIANEIPIKRGVLLGGRYGTGKTLAATVASRLAVDNGVTYLYIPRADELAHALHFAEQYQENACVIFCEDIDRAVSGERSVKMDDILNILDGIDSKNSRIITILTTNHIENINPAMLRPGRLDAVINVTPPDSETALKLLRYYGKDSIPQTEDLTAAANLLDGSIPAVIAEVVKRAKLVQLRMQQPGTKVEGITGTAVLEAAKTMRAQVDLLSDIAAPNTEELSINAMISGAINNALNGTKQLIRDIHTQVV